jgi:hypothetical protein
MRISKIMVVLLVSVVAVTALTGVATASLAICDSSGNQEKEFGPGEDVYITITDNNLPAGKLVDIYVVDNIVWSGGETIDTGGNIYAKYTAVSSNLLIGGNKYKVGTVANPKNYPPAPGGNFTYPNKFDGTSGGYDVVVDCIDSSSNWSPDGIYQKPSGVADGPDYVQYMGCSGFDTVPEFATIAIPAIAVLGLFLFFNKRKHKKD